LLGNYESKENDDQKDTLPLSQRTLLNSPTSSDKPEKSRKPSLIDKVIEKLLESDFDTSRASFRPNNVRDNPSFKNVQNPATLVFSAQNTQRDQIISETNEIKLLVDEIQAPRKIETLHDNKISPIRVKVDLENIIEEKTLQDKAIQLNESEFGAIAKYPVGYLSVGDLVNQSSSQFGTVKKEPVPQLETAEIHKKNFSETTPNLNLSNKTWIHLENEIVDSMRRTHKELSENINVLIMRLKNSISEKDLDELKQVQTKIQFLNRLDVEFQKNKSHMDQDPQNQNLLVMRENKNLIQQDSKVDKAPSPSKQNKPSSSSLKPKQITMSLSSLLDDQLENKESLIDPKPFQNVEIKSTTKKSVSFQKPWEPSLINEAKATSKGEDSFLAAQTKIKSAQLRDKVMSNMRERAGSATGRLTQRQDQSTEFQPLFKTEESQNTSQKTKSPQKKPKYSGQDLEVNKPIFDNSILTRRDTREKIKSKAESKIAEIARGCWTDRSQSLSNLGKHNKTKTPTSQRASNKITKSRDTFHFSNKIENSGLVAKDLHEDKVESLYKEIFDLDQKLAESSKSKETDFQEKNQELSKTVCIHWPEDNYLEKARKKGALRAHKYLKEKNFATSSSSYKASSSSRILTEPAPDTSDMFQQKLDGSFELRMKYTGEAMQRLKSAIKKAV